MTIKQYTPDDHKFLTAWWTTHQWNPVPPTSLPDTGYIVYAGSKPILAGFLYIPRTGDIGWLEWVVSNPAATWEERTDAFVELTKHVEEVARQAGLNSLLTSGENASYIKRMELVGYTTISTNVTHLWKILRG